jgi:hypothetical protein
MADPIGFQLARPLMPTEKDLTDAFERLLERDFPNPDRTGCPGQDALSRFVACPNAPELSILLEHVRRCAPCFEELKRLREKAER